MAEQKLQSRPFGGWISTISGVNTASGSTAALEGGEDQYSYSVAISLNRLEKFGHISPGEVLTAVSDSSSYVVALAENANVASNGRSFIVLQNGYVVRTSTDGTSFNGYAIPIAHAANSLRSSANVDSIIIKDAASTPNEYVIATWEDNGNTADAMTHIVGATGAATQQKSDWFSNGNSANYLIALASPAQVPHKLCQGPDGNIYITNGQYIASATMAAGVSLGAATRNPQALNLGAGWVSSGITSYQNFMAIIGHKATSYIAGLSRSDVRVWLWDGFSPDPNHIYDIPDNYANGICFDGTRLLAFTNGRNNTSKIFEFNGTSFAQIFETGYILPGNALLQGAVDTYQNSLHIGSFGNSDGHVFQLFGRGFHDRTIIKNGSTPATAVGMLKNLYQGQLFVGVAEGSSGTAPFRILYQDQFSKYYVGANLRTGLIKVPYKSTVAKITIIFSQFVDGQSKLFLSMFKGYDTCNPGGNTDILNKQINQIGNDKAYSVTIKIPNISSCYLNFLFNHVATTDTAAIIQDWGIEFIKSDNP